MSRPVLITVFLAIALQVSQAQLVNHGVPASVTSPTADGRQHGVPASVVSPTPLPFGVNPPLRSRGISLRGPLRRFGNPRNQRRVFVPVPLFYPIYTDGFDPYPFVADPSVPLEPQPAQAAESTDREDDLRAVYEQGVRDAMARQGDRRYGEHYLDSRERSNQSPAPAAEPVADAGKRAVMTPVSGQEDKSPATVFIFKDGHQLETRNYAIMSGTLFDFSGKTLKKIQVDDLDTAATVKANDDRGVTVKLN